MKKISKTPAIIATVLIFISFFDVPYGYYNFLKLVIMGISIYYAYLVYGLKNNNVDGYFWILVTIAILFNPFVPIHLYEKSLWIIIDLAVLVLYFVMLSKKNKR